jgi:hypothetical protein
MPNDGLKTAASVTAQVITVSSGLLAFTVTFAEKFTPKDQVIAPPLTLGLSWIAFALSVLVGFWTLMAITGTLNESDAGRAESNPARTNIRIPALLMFALFLAGVVLLIVAGWTIAGPRLTW